MSTIRLDKHLANSGLAARRKIEGILAQGIVTVNGTVITEPGTRIDPTADKILINNKPLRNQQLTYIAYNKPVGVLSSVGDDFGRTSVTDMVQIDVKVFPVGRLDKDSQGLMLLTNDGELAYKLTHPKFEISKTYKVVVSGKTSDDKLEALRNGVDLGENEVSMPAGVKVTTTNPFETIFELTLTEGKKREIRRMMASLHLHVIELTRVSIGSLELGSLKSGQFRPLTAAEISSLKSL